MSDFAYVVLGGPGLVVDVDVPAPVCPPAAVTVPPATAEEWLSVDVDHDVRVALQSTRRGNPGVTSP